MKKADILSLLKAGAHFGHQTSRWHPKMKPFIFTERQGVHIIDLEKTIDQLEEVLAQVTKMAAEGKVILFATTKPQAKDIVKAAAERCGMPYLIDRWLGGMLTNFPEMKKLIAKYNSLKEQQATGELEKYTKKEQLDISKKLEKMDTYLSGLVSIQKMPDVIFTPSVQREKTAMLEANRMGVTVVGVCDTNANPDRVDYVIAANDDAVRSIELMVNLVADAIVEGKKELEKNKDISKKDMSAVPSKEQAA